MKDKTSAELLAELQHSTINGTSKLHDISWEQVIGLKEFFEPIADCYWQINRHLGEVDTFSFTLYSI